MKSLNIKSIISAYCDDFRVV